MSEPTNVIVSQLDSLLNPWFHRLSVWEISSIVEIDWNDSIIARRIEDESRSSTTINPSIDSSILGLIRLNLFHSFLLSTRADLSGEKKLLICSNNGSSPWSKSCLFADLYMFLFFNHSDVQDNCEKIRTRRFSPDDLLELLIPRDPIYFHFLDVLVECHSNQSESQSIGMVSFSNDLVSADVEWSISLQFELIYLYRHGIFHSMLL